MSKNEVSNGRIGGPIVDNGIYYQGVNFIDRFKSNDIYKEIKDKVIKLFPDEEYINLEIITRIKNIENEYFTIYIFLRLNDVLLSYEFNAILESTSDFNTVIGYILSKLNISLELPSIAINKLSNREDEISENTNHPRELYKPSSSIIIINKEYVYDGDKLTKEETHLLKKLHKAFNPNFTTKSTIFYIKGSSIYDLSSEAIYESPLRIISYNNTNNVSNTNFNTLIADTFKYNTDIIKDDLMYTMEESANSDLLINVLKCLLKYTEYTKIYQLYLYKLIKLRNYNNMKIELIDNDTVMCKIDNYSFYIEFKIINDHVAISIFNNELYSNGSDVNKDIIEYLIDTEKDFDKNKIENYEELHELKVYIHMVVSVIKKRYNSVDLYYGAISNKDIIKEKKEK